MVYPCSYSLHIFLHRISRNTVGSFVFITNKCHFGPQGHLIPPRSSSTPTTLRLRWHPPTIEALRQSLPNQHLMPFHLHHLPPYHTMQHHQGHQPVKHLSLLWNHAHWVVSQATIQPLARTPSHWAMNPIQGCRPPLASQHVRQPANSIPTMTPHNRHLSLVGKSDRWAAKLMQTTKHWQMMNLQGTDPLRDPNKPKSGSGDGRIQRVSVFIFFYFTN